LSGAVQFEIMSYMKNFFLNRITLIIITVIIATSAFFAGTVVGNADAPEVSKVSTLINKEQGAPERIDFEAFWKAWNVLNEKYVSTKDMPSDQEKVWGAIEGLAASLGDPYTVFFPPVENKVFESEISGNFEGVGMEVAIKDGILTVVAPLKGSPAERAGILAGDKILKINGTSTIDMSVDKAVKLIRGKKGTTVVLTVLREGQKDTVEKSIVRDVINIPTLDTEIQYPAGTKAENKTKNNAVFVIKLYNFSAISPELFRKALREFIDSGSHKLVLDLRGNPGGYLDAAVSMASWFLPSGKIVVTEDFGKNKDPKVYRSRGPALFNENLKFVVLVDGGSASASEILAGALKEHGVAKVVGTNTFGKGSVQELIKITPETSLKVTVARWLTPKGVSISEGGLKPDVEVKITPEESAAGKDPQMNKALEIMAGYK
jgi:carboxyl-terminal processing protease